MHRKRRYKPKKYKFSKVLSIFLAAISIMSFFVYSESILAEEMGPSFKIEMLEDKISSNIDEEAVITGTIIPNDFSMDILKKRIVFVLDTSGSMGYTGTDKKETRLEKAKKATKIFLEELKDVPNVEVAIVSYSKYANINSNKDSSITGTNNVRYYQTANADDYKFLISLVDGYKANGGTNTAEGLRKAKYMLDYQGSGNIDKNIVFMTDGVPTYYPKTSNFFGTLYKTIDTKNPYIGGTGQDIDSNVKVSKDAAVEIGNLFEGEANVYTVGYSLNTNQATTAIKSIHESMLGNKGKKDKLYYAETNTIEQLFENIVQEIKSEYTTEAVEINLDVKDSLNIKGEYEFFDKDDNPIPNGVISYKSEIKNGKVTYKADPIKFKIRIKSEKVGKFDVEGTIKIKCPELEYEKEYGFKVTITFTDNNKVTPSFDIEITKDKNIASVDDEILVTGTILPNQFKKEITPKRIVFVLDVSDSMTQNGSTRLEKLKCATKEFINKMRDSNNVEIAIVAYSSEAFINPIFDGYTDKLAKYPNEDKNIEYNTAIEQFVYFDPTGDGYDKLIQIVDGLKTSTGTNIAEGLRKAKYILDLNADEKMDKTVILMTDGVPGYYPVSSTKESYKVNGSTVYKLYDQTNTATIRSSSAPYLGGSGGVSEILGEYSEEYVRHYYNIEESKKKAIQIGNLFKGEANVYTIGYELDNTNIHIEKSDSITGSKITKDNYERSVIDEIHQSMISSNKKSDIYYAVTNEIEKLFSDLAVNMSDEYKSEELVININVPEKLQLIGKIELFDKDNNPIDKGIITYKGSLEKGQIIYRADPIKFKIRVKGIEQGTFKIDGDVTMECQDLDYVDTVKFGFNVSYGNRLPEIQAELISQKEINALPDEDITLQYKIIPKEFKLDEIEEADNNLFGVEKVSFDTKLKFDLGENFEIVEYGELNKLENDSDGYNAETGVVTVTYNLGADNIYRPENSERIVSIRVKVKGFEPTMAFGTQNHIVYDGIYGQKMKYDLVTPVVISIQEVDIIHGFYNDVINNGTPEIDEETSDKVLMAGTIRKLAATFKGYRGTNASLNLDSNLKLQGNINVYIINGNETSLYATINSNDYVVDINGEFKYLIDMKGLINNTESMLVIYDVEVPKVTHSKEEPLKGYNSDVQYLGNIKMVTINTKGLESSPELF